MNKLKQNIVIVNEFTINGSRGTTPGNYVLEYMAREYGTENLTPTMVRSKQVQKLEKKMTESFKREPETNKDPNLSDYIIRYMARENATEVVSLDGAIDTETLTSEFSQIQGLSGVAFGPDSLSMSHDEVKRKSKLIQGEHDKGKPVMKTVISFETDYLKEMGVLPKDLNVNKRGDLHGKSDQAKLRLAVQHGIKNISHEFSDLDWIGVIQVDTKHIHCHLAMVDKGRGKHFTRTGQQKGKISDAMKLAIRRGIDNTLTECQIMKPLSIQMESERRNTLSFIKRFTYRVLEERGISQYLLACLPKDDKSLWKASINTDGGPDNMMTIRKGRTEKQVRGNMKKANEIVRSYVIDLLNRPDSGYAESMAIKHDYLEAQRNRGDFDDYITYVPRIINGKKHTVKTKVAPNDAVRIEEEKFREEIITRGINAVYDVLKNIDDVQINHHTPFLDAMSMPYEEMANYVKEDKMIEFGFKLRSYASRLEYHRENYKKINTYIHQYEDGQQAQYAPESRAVYDFLKTEQEYNHSLMCKYQTFLHFFHIRDEYRSDYEDLMYYRHKSAARRAMKNDTTIRRSTPENAERAGQEIYGLQGGSLVNLNPALYEQMQLNDDQEYMRALRNFKEKLATMGLLYEEEKDEISEGLAYKFDDVKAYDLHHMSYDFTYDFKIASVNVNNFIKMADRRFEGLQRAQAYLEKTDQLDLLSEITSPGDVIMAKNLADELRGSDNIYHTKFDNSDLIRSNTATIRLDNRVYDELSNRNVMESLRNIMEEQIQVTMSDTGSDTISPMGDD